MRITVVGAGAIGGFIGTRLAAAGVPVGAVARGATHAALAAHGWRVQEPDGTLLTAPVAALADSANTASVAALGPQDLVVLAVKAQSLAPVLPAVTPLLGPDTVVLPALNGVPWWFFEGFGGPCETPDSNGSARARTRRCGRCASLKLPTIMVVGIASAKIQ